MSRQGSGYLCVKLCRTYVEGPALHRNLVKEQEVHKRCILSCYGQPASDQPCVGVCANMRLAVAQTCSYVLAKPPIAGSRE